MRSETNKSGIVATSVITALLLAILSAVTFVIPFPKADWACLLVVYCCAAFMTLAEGVLTIALFFGKGDKHRKVLGLPIVYSGLIAVLVQLCISAAFYVWSAFALVPLWIPIVVEVLLYCVVAVQLALGFFFKGRSEEYHKSKADTSWMDALRAEAKVLVSIHKEGELGKALEEFYDLAKGSDPVGNEKTLEAEKRIDALLSEFKNVSDDGSLEKEIELVGKMVFALKERNALCKLGK